MFKWFLRLIKTKDLRYVLGTENKIYKLKSSYKEFQYKIVDSNRFILRKQII